MRRVLPWCSLLALAVALCAPATSGATVSIGINISNAPPPPVVVWRAEPRLVVVPGSSIYCYGDDLDYDYFRYGMYFYVFNDGYWYRARRFNGPFVAIHESYVPRAFYAIHDRGYHWKHHWAGKPPGRAKMVRVVERPEHGHGHGHGRGHDKND